MPRTGSIASKVGPAVSSRRLPASSCGWKWAIVSSTISSGSSMRPGPVSPQAWSPQAGPMTLTPSLRKTAMLRRVAGFSHIWRFMAGATSSGQSRARTSVVSRSSARPPASLARKSAEAGATSSASASRDRSMCAMLLATRGSHWSVNTSFPESAWKVTGVTKCVAASLITTCTEAPSLISSRTSSAALYAAMPPVMPRTMRFPASSMSAALQSLVRM